MKFINIIYCIIIYAIFPFSSIFMKLASLSKNFYSKLLLYCCSLLILFVFSFFWQKILKKMPLIQAYIFKSTTLVWNLIYGWLIFGENVKINMIIGILIVMFGIFIILNKNEVVNNEDI